MFAAGRKLYTVEPDGSLFRVDPANGAWVGVGPPGAWKLMRAGAVLQDRLYTAESDGTLRAADLATGERKQVGKTGIGDAAGLFASADALYAIKTDGSLFRVDPDDGSLARVGPAGAWKAIRAGTVFNGRLYTAETDGTLRAANLAVGERKQVGNPDFGDTSFMFAAADQVYTIETNGNLFRVVVKPPESIRSFDWCPEAIETVFRDHGKAYYRNLNARLVLGKKATHAGVLDGQAWLRENTTPKDLVVLYLTCHGFVDPNEGWGVSTPDGQTLWGREMKAELGKLPCPALVLLETCYSGGFARAHKDDPPVPPNVTALCACSETQLANNELDIAAAEALYGRADYNGDGVVDLDELIRYVRERYKDWRRGTKEEDGGLVPAIVMSAALPGSTPLTNVDADLAAVVFQGVLWSALVAKQDGDNYQVSPLGWNPTPGPYFLTNEVTRDCICLPANGPPLMVEQNGTWYPARLLGRQGPDYRVHYLGYNEDEVVTKERIKYPFVGRPKEEKIAAVPPPTTPTALPRPSATVDGPSRGAAPAPPSGGDRPPETAEPAAPAGGSASPEAGGAPAEGRRQETNAAKEFPWLLLAPVFAGPVLVLLVLMGLLLRKRRRALRPSNPPAAVKHRCVHCGAVLKVRGSEVGRKFRCPGCGTAQRLGG
jgi:hypothetical protein